MPALMHVVFAGILAPFMVITSLDQNWIGVRGKLQQLWESGANDQLNNLQKANQHNF